MLPFKRAHLIGRPPVEAEAPPVDNTVTFSGEGLTFNGQELEFSGGPEDASSLAFVQAAWTWYNDPRALLANGKIVLGGVTRAGDIIAVEMDTATGMGRQVTLSTALQIDDHDNPAFLARSSDARLVAAYSAHNGAAQYVAVSTAAGSARAWGAAADIDAQVGGAAYSYANLVEIGGTIYNFFRENANDGYYSTSTDGGVTWAAHTKWLDNGSERPYLKVIKNGSSRIDFTMTDGHPNEVAANSIYHCYFDGSVLRKSDGTSIGTLGGSYVPATHFTQVYDGTTTLAWTHDIMIDGGGLPVIGYATFPTPASDHRYHRARWNGSVWTSVEVCAAGGPLYAGETYYSGGMCIDRSDPDTVYTSRQVSGFWNLYKQVTSDGGSNWTETQLTSNHSSNFRPFHVAGTDYLAYLEGSYTAYTNFNTVIRLLEI